jgi:AcrR family transcriptional regulator
MTTGLRERRKQEARRSISGVAMALFADRGFDEVTIPQVADAAGVSKMTVTNYFPRKEDLVFDRADATIRSLADAVDARAPGESLLAAIRRDFAERMAAGDVTLGVPTATFARMVANSHVLTSRGREIADLTEQALGDAIAAEAGVDGPQHRIVAAELASVHRVLFAEGTRRVLAGQPRDEICQALAAAASRAFDLLEPSLGGYGSSTVAEKQWAR